MIEEVARRSYGRLLAILAARCRDIAAAEDALGEALVAALQQWPVDGVPANPEAWLMTAAKRRLIDESRRASVRSRAELLDPIEDVDDIPDARLRLLFVCTHPALAPDVQVPLMLQSVLGLDAAAIAAALCVAPKTMGQRLWRAKGKIRDAGVPFEVPEREQLRERVDAVLEAIYAAYGTAWEDGRHRHLADEAIFLARLLVELLPDEAEAKGLLALMLFAESRRAARRDHGRFVPLDRQDRSRWDTAMIGEAEDLLRAAAGQGVLGVYQLEAALQSAHVHGDRPAIVELYDGLCALAPTLGARVGRAAAILDLDAAAALAALDELGDVRDYQPYWACRGEILRALGRTGEAREAFERAIGLSEDPAVREYLASR